MRLLAILLLFLPLWAQAHGDAHESISLLDVRILLSPSDPELYLNRGLNYLEAEHYPEARADLEKALALDPGFDAARYYLAEVLRKANRLDEAEAAARRHLQATERGKTAELARGHWLLGDILAARGRHLEATEAYGKATPLTAILTPSQIQAHALAYQNAGGAYLNQAIQVIDHGLGRIGPVDHLIELALNLELKAGRVDAALARLDGWIGLGRSLPFLHARKARILAEAGRHAQARTALDAAGAALAAIPETRRKSRAYRDLAREMAAIATLVSKS
jgi:tetratricopeptide (TPR) repeat protein